MFSESYTAYLLTSLIALLNCGLKKFIDLCENSRTAYILTNLIKRIKKSYDESVIIAWLYGVCDWIAKHIATPLVKPFKESCILSFFKKDLMAKYYKTSVFYSVFDSVLGFVFDLIRKIQILALKILESSVILKVFNAVRSLPFFTVNRMLAIFLGVMFVVPHNYWNNLYAFLGAVFFTFWIFMNIASGKIKGRSTKGISAAIVGFVLATVVSTITAISFSDAVRIGLFLLASVMFAYSIYASVDTKEKLVEFLKIVLTCVAITAIIGIVQRIIGVEVDYEFVDARTNSGMPGRVFSTFSNPNNFAELLVMFMPFLVPLFISAEKKTERLFALGGFGVILAALAMTYSRSCWVGFALATLMFVFIYNKKLIIPVILIALAAFPLLPETIINRIFTIGSMQDSSNAYRIYIWKGCMNLIDECWATGLGLGPASFKAVYPFYADIRAVSAPHSHMIYMELIIEMGIFGFITFFAFMYSVVKKVVKAMKKMDKTMKAIAVAGLSALFAMAFVCTVEYVWFYPRDMFAFWILPGVLMATTKIAEKSKN